MQSFKCEPNKNAAIEFLEIANNDLSAATLLFDNKKYSQSVFFLQQSIEKGCKSFGLYHGIFGEEYLLKIRHNPLEVYKKNILWYQELLNKIKDSPSCDPIHEFILLLDQVEDIDDSFINFLKLPIDDLNNEFDSQFQEFSKISSETELMNYLDSNGSQLKKYLKILRPWMIDFEKNEKIYNNSTGCKKIIDQKLNLIKPLMMEWAENECRKYRSNHLIRKRLNQAFDKQFPLYEKSLEITLTSYFYEISSMYPLLFLSLIIRAHENYSRYPKNKLNFHPPLFYTKNLPLISVYPELSNYTQISLRRLQQHYALSDIGIEGLNAVSQRKANGP